MVFAMGQIQFEMKNWIDLINANLLVSERAKKMVLVTTRLMVNPDNGTLYRPDYRFDPYTGTPLAQSAIEADQLHGP